MNRRMSLALLFLAAGSVSAQQPAPDWRAVEQALGRAGAAGIAVTAVHSHLMTSTPALLFVHFWGMGSASDLATGLGAALAATKQ